MTAIAFAFTSCRKDRVCECTDSFGAVTRTTIKNATKREAKANCFSRKEYFGNIVNETDCTLK